MDNKAAISMRKEGRKEGIDRGGWRTNSVEECLPGIHKTSSTTKRKRWQESSCRQRMLGTLYPNHEEMFIDSYPQTFAAHSGLNMRSAGSQLCNTETKFLMALSLKFPSLYPSASCETSAEEYTKCWTWCLKIIFPSVSLISHKALHISAGSMPCVLFHITRCLKSASFLHYEDLTVPESTATSLPVPE